MDILSALQRQIVCSGGRTAGDNNLSTAGNSTSFRNMFYCPRGAKSLRLLLTGFYTSGSQVETSLVDPILINLGIEISAAAPWDPLKNYGIGEKATFGFSQYSAVAPNLNSQPTASNANWSATAISRIVPVTANGVRAITLPTATTPAGATVTQGLLETDSIPVSIPAGSWIAIGGFIAMSGAQVHALGAITRPLLGEFWNQAASQTDRTTTGAVVVSSANPSYAFGAVLGAPLSDGPTVGILGDSRAASLVGRSVSPGSVTINSGGTGYVASDVGKILSLPNTGGSTYCCATPSRYMITSVSGGAVNGLITVDPGQYTNPSLITSQTLPTGVQVLVGSATGSGLSIASPTFAGGFDLGGPLGGQGFIARGLDKLGIPYVYAARSSDTLDGWIARSYSRLAYLKATGASTIVFALGINNIGDGLSTWQTKVTQIVTDLRGLPTVKRVLFPTMPPFVTAATDGFLTTGAQTKGSNEATRVAANDWGRTSPIFDGCLETADPVENARNGGFWKSDGLTICQNTADGLHLTSVGAETASAGVVAGQSLFI